MLILAPLETRQGLVAFPPSLEDALVGQRWPLGRAARLRRQRMWPVVTTAGVGLIAGAGALAASEDMAVHYRTRWAIRHEQSGDPGAMTTPVARPDLLAVLRSSGMTKFQAIRTETMPCATDGW